MALSVNVKCIHCNKSGNVIFTMKGTEVICCKCHEKQTITQKLEWLKERKSLDTPNRLNKIESDLYDLLQRVFT